MAEQSIPIPMDMQGAQSMDQGKGAEKYQPTDEEKDAIKLATKLFEKSKAWRKQYDQHWLDDYKMFRGKQWKEQRPSYRHSEVFNMIFQTIQSQVPILTDTRPRIDFLPEDPQDREVAEILGQVAESDWQRFNWLEVLTEIIFDSHIYGTAFGGLDYDKEARFGLGAIDYSAKDPFYLFPDPAASNINKRAKFMCYAEPVDVDELKTQYPDHAKYIRADLQDLAQGDKTDLDQVHFRSPVDNRTIVEGVSQHDLRTKDQALKLIVDLKSDEYIEEQEKELDPNTNEEKSVFIQKKKYPNGRRIVLASGVLLSDGAIPYDDGLFPYARLVNYILPREFYGESEVRQLSGPQKTFNKLVSFALDIYTLMGNPIWVVDTAAEIDTDNLINRPGLVVEKAPGSEVRREPGLDVSPTLLALIDRIRTWFNETSGMTDLSRGAEPKDITAASAISALQEAAQTRLRLKSRHIDAHLQDAGSLYKNRVFQFYDQPQVFRLTGNENAQKYFKFHIETQRDDEGNPVTDQAGNPIRTVHYHGFSEHPETGQLMPDAEIRQLQIKADFAVKVSTGSALPFAKAEKFNQSMKMYQAGIIDDEEVLKSADYPNWQAVLERVNQKKQAVAQAQAQSQAQAKGGGRPPV